MKIFSFPPSFHLFIVLIVFVGFISCKNSEENSSPDKAKVSENQNQKPFFKLSLAQWSLHRQIFNGELDPIDFAEKANELGFSGIEYVSAFYGQQIKEAANQEAAMQELLKTLKAKSEEFNVENVLIMVDGEGDLSTPDEEERKTAVENHKKWVDAAQFLGCHSIRVNLSGSEDEVKWQEASVDGLIQLSEYAAEKDINILVENHGHFSSNAQMLTEVIKKVDLANCGTLPDFGNFCIKRGDQNGETSCVEDYPKYQGVQEMMPYAKAVSAKSYDFDEDGKETTIDYEKMLEIVKDAGYAGFIGVEYEGQNLSEEEGIKATKELLLEVGSKLNEEE